MNLKMALIASYFSVLFSFSSLANVGVFGGTGQSIRLESSNEIQMVSEDVNIYLARAEQPVTGGVKWMEVDKAHYKCLFELKNLTDKEVAVTVGFPLAGENYVIPHKKKETDIINQGAVIAQFNFIAGTVNGTYPVRYVKADKDKKFAHIFLWDMSFKAKETINLQLSYSMIGYYGLGTTRKKPYNWNPIAGIEYLNEFETSSSQMFGYVTATGNSWQGNIEKAKFTIEIGEYEKYLNKRGAFEIDEDFPYYKKRDEHAPFSTLYRTVTPDGWKEEGEKNKRRLVYSFTDFKPGMEININYSFLHFPKTLGDYQKTVASIKTMYNKNREMSIRSNRPNIKIPPEWNGVHEKNISDLILEFYGIETGNADIKPFLDRQEWYPVKSQHEMDAALKEHLQKKQ